MSTKQFYRSALMAATGIAALGLTACANGHASDRYGASHYDYETTGTCAGACGGKSHVPAYKPAPAPVPVFTHYDYESSPGGCVTRSPCGGIVSGGYTSTVSTGHISTGHVSTGHIASPSFSSEVAPCPAGTTTQPDGTCLQNGHGYVGSSYSSGSVISSGSSYSSGSYSSGSISSSTIAAECPAGTTAQPDGTCLQHSGSSYSFSSTTTHTTPVTTYTPPVTTYTPPVVTDCHLSGVSTGCSLSSTPTNIYVGDAVTSGSSYSSGYQSSGVYSSSDYLPIRK